MYLLKQSSTSRPLLFYMTLSSDHISPATGLTCTVILSKNGAAFAAAAGAVSEVGNGWYAVAPNATDTNTLGILLLHATAAGADPTDAQYEVGAFDPHDGVRLGLTGLPNANAGAAGGLPLGDGSGAVSLTAAQLATLNKLTALVPVQLTVASVTDSSHFTANVGATANYLYWEVVWNTGNNAGFDAVAVSAFSNAAGVGSFTLENAAPNSIQAGDTFYIVGADQPKELLLFLTQGLGTDNKVVLSANTQPAVTLPANAPSTFLDTISIADVASDTDARSTLPKMLRALFNRHFNKVTATATQMQVCNDANAAVQTLAVSDDGTTATKGKSA